MLLSDYLKLTRDERTAHIDLSTPCERGQNHADRSVIARTKLAELYDLELDVSSRKSHICHRCECGSQNGYCLNPKHFYLGTVRENRYDAYEDDSTLKGRSWQKWNEASHTSEANAKRHASRLANAGYNVSGENNPRAKLTNNERHIIANSTETAKTLAERYGVSRTRIYQLRKNK